MAGSISLSMTQQLDEFGDPLAGGHLFFIQAGTVSTPQNAFQDSALTLPWPNPVILSASGRIPQLFFADGSIKIRLTDVNGVEILVADGILVVGASSGGGGGSPVDATTVLATGDIKCRYGTGVLAGFVRLAGRTIGSATSGASERANADTQSLFEYLWNNDTNLAVSTGRGGSSAADWAANKTIALPDFRSRSLCALSDMGNSTDTGFSSVTFATGNATTLGSALGQARRTILATNVPALTSTNATQAISVTVSEPNGRKMAGPTAPGENVTNTPCAAGTSQVAQGSANGAWSNIVSLTGTTNNSISVTSTGTTGAAFDAISPFLLVTFYGKL